MNSKKYEKLKEITDSFIECLHDLYGLYFDATRGFGFYKKEQEAFIEKNQTTENTPLTIANSNPDDPDPLILHVSSFKEIILRNQEEGTNINKTRQYFIIMIDAIWDERIREQIAGVLGLEKDDLKCDIMGDIRKIRNDILKHSGIESNSRKGKIIKFQKNEKIIITKPIFEQIFNEIFDYLNQLFFQETGQIAYSNKSLNQKAYENHIKIKHIVRK